MALSQEELVIEPGKTEKNYWMDLWRYRELFYILSWRDVKVRYKQTVIGASWALLRPLLTMLIFTFIFGRVAGMDTDPSVPYALVVLSAMLPWQFFSAALSEASNSLIGNTNLVSKVYFPRLIIPASSVITSLVDFAISFIILAVMMVVYRFAPGWNILLLPLFILLAFLASFGVGLFVTALNVKYRDFRYIIPFIVQFGLFVSPVGWVSSRIPEEWRLLYSVNPMVGVIDGFRWCIIGYPMYWPGFLMSVAITLIFLFIGIRYFRKTEKSFADNI
jgi:lipopolysaccharide transport system permease protein